MGEFLHKLNSNKALKIGFCVVVGLAFWLLYLVLFPNKQEDVTANIVVTQKAPGITIEQNDNLIIEDEAEYPEVKEQLNYKYMSNVEYVRVITLPENVEFSKEYAETTLRTEMAQEMLNSGMFTNISLEQMIGTWDMEVLESTSKRTAYFEYGAVKDMQYAGVYVKVGNNFVYAGGFARHDESKDMLCNAIKDVNTNVGDYIQQARESATK